MRKSGALSYRSVLTPSVASKTVKCIAKFISCHLLLPLGDAISGNREHMAWTGCTIDIQLYNANIGMSWKKPKSFGTQPLQEIFNACVFRNYSSTT